MNDRRWSGDARKKRGSSLAYVFRSDQLGITRGLKRRRLREREPHCLIARQAILGSGRLLSGNAR